MPRLLYISMARFPTEKAHGLQIAQNCEAFVNAGYEVELWVSTRHMHHARHLYGEPYQYYGVDASFEIKRIPALDLYPLMFGNTRLERIAFYLHSLTYCLAMLIRLLFTRADVYYSRDEYVMLALSLVVPRHKLAFEVHQFSPSRIGGWIQSQVAQRCGSIIAITSRLREDFITERGAASEQIIIAHDGVRAQRFQDLPDKHKARQMLGWSDDAFIVGFVGRLQMLNTMDKGVGILVKALEQFDDTWLALVGGPDDSADALRQQWRDQALPDDHFLYAGQVEPDQVPIYLRAFDVCAMPHPFNQQFAYYTSPLKLFEYMAAERAIVASDLPGWSDVVQHEVNALLVPPSDVEALAAAIQRLKEDRHLRQQLGENARQTVMQQHTWCARAGRIRNHLDRAILSTDQ